MKKPENIHSHFSCISYNSHSTAHQCILHTPSLHISAYYTLPPRISVHITHSLPVYQCILHTPSLHISAYNTPLYISAYYTPLHISAYYTLCISAHIIAPAYQCLPHIPRYMTTYLPRMAPSQVTRLLIIHCPL